MNCTKCGAQLMEDSVFCEVCGTRVTSGERNTFTQNQQMAQEQLTKYYVNPGFNTGRIRKWFLGNPLLDLLFAILIFLGDLLSLFGLIMMPITRDSGCLFSGILLIAVGIGGKIYAKSKLEDNVAEIAEAWYTYVDILSKRGMQKLNLIQEEVALIEPVVLVGVGEVPNNSYEISKGQAKNDNLQRLLRFASGENDPIEKYKIDRCGDLRSLLLQVSVYMFSGNQVFVYVGNIDISTGLIYKEGSSEVFFQDIEGFAFNQEILKVYNERNKVRESKVMETFVLYLAGCKLKSSVLLQSNDMSVVENQLTGMRSLIRDKKNEV